MTRITSTIRTIITIRTIQQALIFIESIILNAFRTDSWLILALFTNIRAIFALFCKTIIKLISSRHTIAYTIILIKEIIRITDQALRTA